MASEETKPTLNGGLVMSAVTNDAAKDVKMLRVDPSTGRLLVDASVTVSGLATAVTDGETVDAAYTGNLAMGTDGSNYQILKTDSLGELQIDVLTSALPTGAATSAKQDTGNTSLATIAGAVSGTEVQVDVLTMPTVTVSATNLDIRDLSSASDSVSAVQATASNLNMVAWGWDGAANRAIATDSAGNAQVDVLTMPTVAVTGTFWQATQPVSAASLPLPTGASTLAEQQTQTTALGTLLTSANFAAAFGTAGTADSQVMSIQGIASMTPVQIGDNSSSITVDNGGTFAVQVDGAALTSLQLIDDTIFTDDTSTHSTGTTKGVGIMAAATPTDGSINANDIGMLAMSVDRRLLSDVNLQVADSDVSTTNAVPTKGVPSDIDINGSNANHADKYYTNAGAVTDGIIWSPAAGKRWHVLTLYINVSAAATVTIEDDLAAGDNARWKGEFAANSGVVLTYDKEHPFSSAEDAADLIITTSAGNVYVQAVGYEV